MGVRRQIRVVIAPPPGALALFGFLKPRLVLPENALRKLNDRELRMIFLHELTHVKRGDILLNWIIIFASSLHWFNPLAWLAMRRLRADRELVCDAMVLSRLAADERRAYGNTLIKLLDDFSGAGFCPSLAPVLNHKQEIKRRVTMIAEFKPTRGIAFLLPATIVVALCCLTFTRAAEKKGVSSGNAKNNRTAESTPANEKSQSPAQLRIEYLKKQLQEKNDEVLQVQDRTDQLRKELRISDAVAEGTGSIDLNPETIRRLESARIKVESQYRELNSLVTLLKAKSDSELQKIINVTVPDEMLTSLLKAKAETEQRLANLSSKFGPENPEVKGLREEHRKVSDQIAERVQGILEGLNVRAAAMKAQMESLYRAVDEAKARDIDLAAKYRPYFEAKRRLENLEKIRDAILLRLEQGANRRHLARAQAVSAIKQWPFGQNFGPAAQVKSRLRPVGRKFNRQRCHDLRTRAKPTLDFAADSPSPRPSSIGWERENRAPPVGVSNCFGSCERRVWLFPLPSDGRGSG